MFEKELLNALITIQMGAPAGALALTHGSVTSPPSPGNAWENSGAEERKKKRGTGEGSPGDEGDGRWELDRAWISPQGRSDASPAGGRWDQLTNWSRRVRVTDALALGSGLISAMKVSPWSRSGRMWLAVSGVTVPTG